MTTVSLVRCEDYDYQRMEEAVCRSFENLGGIDKFIKPNMKVLIKANLLLKRAPERAATTNPVLVEAIAKAAVAQGASVVIADSPGGPYTPGLLKGVYQASGMADAAKRNGAVLNYGVGYRSVKCEGGVVSSAFDVIDPVLDADIVISVAKLKTHGFATFTGAVKNLFGVIPGTLKAEYHLRLPDIGGFSEMLVDLCETVRPALSFIDGVVGMEGEGPSGGSPRKIGAVIAGTNPHMVDLAACKIIGLDQKSVPTLGAAKRRGLLDEADYPACRPEDFYINDYQIPQAQKLSGIFKLLPWLTKTFPVSPRVESAKCISCGVCAQNCPAKAITMDGVPNFDYDKCFRCYCCQELCPKTAISVKRIKLLARLSGKGKTSNL